MVGKRVDVTRRHSMSVVEGAMAARGRPAALHALTNLGQALTPVPSEMPPHPGPSRRGANPERDLDAHILQGAYRRRC